MSTLVWRDVRAGGYVGGWLGHKMVARYWPDNDGYRWLAEQYEADGRRFIEMFGDYAATAGEARKAAEEVVRASPAWQATQAAPFGKRLAEAEGLCDHCDREPADSARIRDHRGDDNGTSA